ncbi:RimJ/RimL family protein N-acetyltransferase [Litorimonas taeanensis]|uniref:RimJ/RimL family protein N-acetyltransferase n=1 Tax=Litorimonas taeanensis TaxID=568099 RepID=A0A420WJB9_9PROT|nr:GNAT family N-acetyltransferase [Litorimonas taeanensis]RKQ71029.1 RimJ/RimL family protein N-acetyltransferase [Litorimonas taeanensis]
MREIIETENLVLRQLKDKDAMALSKYGSNFDIARMTGSFPHPFPLISAEFKIMHLRSMHERGLAYPYAITENGSDEMIGIMDLCRKSDEDTLEIGYWIAEPAWGKGYASEAGQAILAEADASLKPKKVIAGAFTDNPASHRVLEKMGFMPTGKTEMYFSMARMEKADSALFEREAVSIMNGG